MRKKILIVEDNTELLELMRSNLRQAGFATMGATNGLDALKKARSGSPDLILLDLVLPELDGFAVCEHLRKDPAMMATPIIILTGLTSSMTRYAGLESGANEYVTKPAKMDHLLSRIEHWLQAQISTPASEATANSEQSEDSS
jgi:DNA-binding response OmpR family regulator